jgi:hypothetical protein
MTPKPPSSKQLAYLRALTQRTGQTFVYPKTSRQASRQIQRLKRARPSTRTELAIERLDLASEQAARDANSDVPVSLDEVQGHGSTCTWRRS